MQKTAAKAEAESVSKEEAGTATGRRQDADAVKAEADTVDADASKTEAESAVGRNADGRKAQEETAFGRHADARNAVAETTVGRKSRRPQLEANAMACEGPAKLQQMIYEKRSIL